MPMPSGNAARTSWRDYPALFLEAWSVVLRGAAAGGFTGLVWLVIYLSDEVLRIVRLLEAHHALPADDAATIRQQADAALSRSALVAGDRSSA